MKFEKAYIEVVELNVNDVITTSNTQPECPNAGGGDCFVL